MQGPEESVNVAMDVSRLRRNIEASYQQATSTTAVHLHKSFLSTSIRLLSLVGFGGRRLDLVHDDADGWAGGVVGRLDAAAAHHPSSAAPSVGTAGIF